MIYFQGIYPTAIIVLVAVQRTVRDMTVAAPEYRTASQATNTAAPTRSPSAPRLSLVMGLDHRNPMLSPVVQIDFAQSLSGGDGDDIENSESRTRTLVDEDGNALAEKESACATEDAIA